MSRYSIPTKDAVKYVCVVGYDNPLQTFFAYVYDKDAVDYNNNIDLTKDPEVEGKNELVYSCGYLSHEIKDVKELTQLISPWAIIDIDIQDQLVEDQKNSSGPNEFQKRMINIVEDLMKKQV